MWCRYCSNVLTDLLFVIHASCVFIEACLKVMLTLLTVFIEAFVELMLILWTAFYGSVREMFPACWCDAIAVFKAKNTARSTFERQHVCHRARYSRKDSPYLQNFFFLCQSELAEGALSQAVAVFTWQSRWTNHSIGDRKQGDKLKITQQLRYEVNMWLQCGPRSTCRYENYCDSD